MPILKIDRKKDGKQGYRVIVNYTAIDGSYKKTERTVYGKAEAQEAEQELLRTVAADPKSAVTLADLCAEYLDYMKSEIRESTWDKKRRSLHYGVLPYLGEKKLRDINDKTLNQWRLAVSKMDIVTRTRQNYYSELRALLNYAVKRKYFPVNPLSTVDNFRDAYAKKSELDFYTPEEWLRFHAAARTHAEQGDTVAEWGCCLFFEIAFYTGMRKGEINALTWRDIDGNLIRVRKSVTQKLKGSDRVTPPKNASSNRDIEIPDPLLDALTAHRARQQLLPGFSPDWNVCGADKPLRDSTIEHHNSRNAREAGVKHIRIHDFRHTHASLLIQSGINILEISRRLGHSDVKETLNTYAHLYPQESTRALEILNKIKMQE